MIDEKTQHKFLPVYDVEHFEEPPREPMERIDGLIWLAILTACMALAGSGIIWLLRLVGVL